MVLYKSLNYRTTYYCQRKIKNSTVFETDILILMAANYIDITPVLIRLYFFHSILRDLDAEFLRR